MVEDSGDILSGIPPATYRELQGRRVARGGWDLLNNPQFAQILVWFWPLEIHPFQCFHHDPGNHIITIPFAIRWDHMPRRVMGAAEINRVLVSFLEFAPMRAHF